MTFKEWLHDFFVSLDEFAGSLFPRSLPGQTISSRAATARDSGHLWGCWLCKFLDYIDPDHCNEARANDIKRAQAVIDDLRT